MKQRFLMLLLAVLVIAQLSACRGWSASAPASIPPVSEAPVTVCAPETEEAQAEDPQVYAELLEHVSAQLSKGDFDSGEGETGIWEAVQGRSPGEGLALVGYAIRDISGDGIPELVIGGIADSACYGSEIYAVYTAVNGVPVLTLEGWSRNRCRYLGDGEFLSQGSGGAMYTMLGTYTLSPDGRTLLCGDFYFTFEKDESFTEIGYYHNTSGAWDKAVSEELDISPEAFWAIAEALEEQIQPIELIPFSRYPASGQPKATVEPQVSVQWAEDGLDGFSAYDTFTADTAQPQSRVLFTTDARVENVQVLALTLENVDENGHMTFATQALYTLEALTPEHPLVVAMTFYGAIPNYGISYVDGNGAARSFAVEMSGEDGSLMLWALDG